MACLRYKRVCAIKRKIPELQQLPFTSTELAQHFKRVAYASGVVKRAIEQNLGATLLLGLGWKANNHNLEIDWVIESPARESILESITCYCTIVNAPHSCDFFNHGLRFTEVCGCTIRSNDSEADDYDSGED